jgi:hypothetical protein
MLKKEQTRVLKKFRDYVIKQSKSNLTKKKKNVSKGLYESLEAKFKVMPNSFSLQFLMDDYGIFQDKGVSGKKKKYNTPFSYSNKMPPRGAILKWVNARRMRLKDKETGKFIRGGQNSLAFLIQRSIFQKGIKPSLFFTKPFEAAFKRLPKDFIDAYGLDFEKFLDFSLKK